ncbi:MAG: YqaA family protein [Robiginitomaculum sp.]
MIFKFAFLERWYVRVKEMARHKHALRALIIIAFTESFIFPVPTSIILMSMVQANRDKAWRYATICAIASVMGAIVGYGIGWYAYETFAVPLLEKMGKAHSIESFKGMVEQYGALAVFGAGLTPFPFKVITILSGALKLNFIVFFLASIVARFAQFFLAAGLVWKFGQQAEEIMKKHFAIITTAVFALITAGWLLWKFVFSGH